MWGLNAADASVDEFKCCRSPAAKLGASGLNALNDTIRGDDANYTRHFKNLSVNGFRAYRDRSEIIAELTIPALFQHSISAPTQEESALV
jgi:hypothetical protein